jgi:hypothetical protein
LLDQPVVQEVVDAALSDRLSGEGDARFRVLDIWSDVSLARERDFEK